MKRAPHRAAKVFPCVRRVEYGLAVAAHKADFIGGNARLCAHGLAGVGAELTQIKVQKAQFLRAAEIACCHAQNARPRCVRERQREKRQQPHAGIRAAAADLHQGGVYAVGRRTAHQPNGQARACVVMEKSALHKNILLYMARAGPDKNEIKLQTNCSLVSIILPTGGALSTESIKNFTK